MKPPPSVRSIYTAWWPLAASWLFMGIELPLISAVMTRLPDSTIHLAAYGGVVFPIALIIEAPVIMLLSASTALSVDWASFRKVYNFMMLLGALTTALHVLIAFTPLFDVIVTGWMKVPAEIVEPSRIGLKIMLPWTWTIAYRRYHQGVLIRFGQSKAISIGTVFRLAANALTLFIGWAIGGLPGIVVGTSAIAAGVITEAIYAGLRTRPVLRTQVKSAPPVIPALTWKAFFNFYTPLAITSMINLAVQPMGSGALSRMPLALESLAVWPVLNGFLFMWRSLGFAYSEVVVAQLDEHGSMEPLRRFTLLLTTAVTVGIFAISASPLARIWFEDLSGLEGELLQLSLVGLWVAVPWPAISVAENYYQGVIVNGRKTVGVTVSVFVFVAVTLAILVLGAASGQITGLYIGLAAFQIGYGAQALYLWYASRHVLNARRGRDNLPTPNPVSIEIGTD